MIHLKTVLISRVDTLYVVRSRVQQKPKSVEKLQAASYCDRSRNAGYRKIVPCAAFAYADSTMSVMLQVDLALLNCFGGFQDRLRWKECTDPQRHRC